MPTRADFRARILRAADATGSSRWDVTPGGEIDQWLGVVFDKEWKRILNVNAHYRMQRLNVTSDSAGYYDTAALITGTIAGNDLRRWYRVLGLQIDDIVYEENSFKNYKGASSGLERNAGPSYLWWFEGDDIMALPKTANKPATIWVNWLPQRPDTLTADTVVVDFPDGYENVVTYETAAMLLMKGGMEAGAAGALQQQAEILRQDMLQDLARRSTNPTRMQYSDLARDWGV